jgi:release factor glutamine methyltransferase
VSASPLASDYGRVVDRLRDAGCVFAEEEAELLIDAARTPRELSALVDQRAAGVPLEYVVGWAEFCGLRVAVEPGVFVPRRRTELLAREAAARARPGAVVVDMCCGSGAIGAVVIATVPQVDMHAVDIDLVAVRCARRNVASGHVYHGDLYEPLPIALRDHVDVIVANAPYVPTDAIALLPPEARSHEPREALDGGADGLDMQRRIIEAAPSWLAPGGTLLIETSEPQAPQTVAAFAHSGLHARVVSSDALAATVVLGNRP